MEENREQTKLPQEKSTFFSTRFIRFLGGKNLLFLLITLLLIGCVIYIFDTVSFIFEPLRVLFDVVILPGVLGVILFYLMRPALKILLRWKVPRFWSIVILFILALSFITTLILLVYPFLQKQLVNLLQEFPIYFMSLVESIIAFLNSSRINEFLSDWNINYDQVLIDVSEDLTTTVKETFTNLATGIASGVTNIVTKVTGILLSLVIVPFILFYLLWEGEKMPDSILRKFPPRSRKFVGEILHDMDNQFS
ncbi:MAG: AI-2E family transporter, partial [Lysinibacillus sp.]